MTKLQKFIKNFFAEELSEKFDSELEIERDDFGKEFISNEIELAEELAEELAGEENSYGRCVYHFYDELVEDTDLIYKVSENVQKDW